MVALLRSTTSKQQLQTFRFGTHYALPVFSCISVLLFSNHTRAWLDAVGRHEALFHQKCTKNSLAYRKTHLSDTLTLAYHSRQSHSAHSGFWPIDSFTVQQFPATSDLVIRFALAELHP
ncbi:hypothetical protein HBH94_061480 [Parastagonospora nodorum]|nr:hypothetical protein HBH94_061480 [Parastagonospora nodorum]KAH5276371.1 hypothetical protein HBI71_030470 [Parastagonospora nodorum]